MNPKLRWTKRAYSDLEEIANFVGVEQQRQRSAVLLVDAILKKCNWYAANPLMGQPFPDLAPALGASE